MFFSNEERDRKDEREWGCVGASSARQQENTQTLLLSLSHIVCVIYI